VAVWIADEVMHNGDEGDQFYDLNKSDDQLREDLVMFMLEIERGNDINRAEVLDKVLNMYQIPDVDEDKARHMIADIVLDYFREGNSVGYNSYGIGSAIHEDIRCRNNPDAASCQDDHVDPDEPEADNVYEWIY